MNLIADLFVKTIDIHDKTLDVEGQIMFEVGGEEAFEPIFDEKLAIAISNFVGTTADAVRQLSPRVCDLVRYSPA